MGSVLTLFLAAWVWMVGTIGAAPCNGAREEGAGLLEVDSNIAGIKLSLCPKEHYLPRETKAFFGLITSVAYVCAIEEIPVGETPLKPIQVPAGKYILMIPSDYVWEEEGPVELTILPGEKTYLLLKLFSSRPNSPESDHGGGGGGGGGGAR